MRLEEGLEEEMGGVSECNMEAGLSNWLLKEAWGLQVIIKMS